LDEDRRGVLRLADGELDFAQSRRWRHAGEELAQFLERIGLQPGEIGIHSEAGK